MTWSIWLSPDSRRFSEKTPRSAGRFAYQAEFFHLVWQQFSFGCFRLLL
jgi:hypothetical protein